MNKNQEEALFGNVLPEEIRMDRDIVAMGGILKVMMPDEWDECKRILSLARSQREAIGALIELVIDHQLYFSVENGDIGTELNPILDTIQIIISAVIKDTWEDVRKAWEENQ